MNKVCVVIGVGPGNGEALVRRFCQEGYDVAMLARSKDFIERLAGQLPNAHAFVHDASDLAAAPSVFARIEQQLGAVSVLLYNAGGGVFKSAEDASVDDFEANWRNNVGGLVAAFQAALLPVGHFVQVSEKKKFQKKSAKLLKHVFLTYQKIVES